jgi:hypothetical protein
MGMWPTIMLSAYAVPILVYLAFALPALYQLRNREMDETSRAVWALAVIAVPVMGAVAFAAVGQGNRPR